MNLTHSSSHTHTQKKVVVCEERRETANNGAVCSFACFLILRWDPPFLFSSIVRFSFGFFSSTMPFFSINFNVVFLIPTVILRLWFYRRFLWENSKTAAKLFLFRIRETSITLKQILLILKYFCVVVVVEAVFSSYFCTVRIPLDQFNDAA